MSIASEITALQTDRTNIANAITAKGGTVSSGDGFDDFATDIGTIATGSLPSIVTSMNGGSVTFATPQTGWTSVQHGLGTTPKGIIYYLDGADRTDTTFEGLVYAAYNKDSTNAASHFRVSVFKKLNTTNYFSVTGTDNTVGLNYAVATAFGFNNSSGEYKMASGVTYKWLAWV